jgi:hypothetical protein
MTLSVMRSRLQRSASACHGSKRAEIDALLALPQPYAAKQRLLIAAAMAGETVSADVLEASGSSGQKR